MWYYFSCAERAPLNARVVELVDSLASGASARKGVRVRLPPRAPTCIDKKDAGKNPALRCGIFATKDRKRRKFRTI